MVVGVVAVFMFVCTVFIFLLCVCCCEAVDICGNAVVRVCYCVWM